MEKRFVVFIVLTMIIVVGYNLLLARFGPQPDPKAQQAAKAEKEKADQQKADQQKAEKAKADQEKGTAEAPDPNAAGAKDAEQTVARKDSSHRIVSLGSFQSAGGSPLLLTLNSRGAALERVELVGRNAKGELRYRDLDNMGGYFGNLSLVAESPHGCRVQVVPLGTPAASAQPADAQFGIGLQVGDIIRSVNGKRVSKPEELDAEFARLKPNQSVKIELLRAIGEKPTTIAYSATLSVRPFQLIQPEPLEKGETQPHPMSLLLSVRSAGDTQAEFVKALRDADWEVIEPQENPTSVEFRLVVDSTTAREFGLAGPVEVYKRYRLGAPLPAAANVQSKIPLLPYHIDFEFGIVNKSERTQNLAYRLDGTNGLPTEGWWYLAKINPAWFRGAGARDILLRTLSDGHRLIDCPSIFKRAKKDDKSPNTPLFSEQEPARNRTWSYIGVDTQYFASALIPVEKTSYGRATSGRAEAVVYSDPTKKPKGWERTANVTYQLYSDPIALEPKAEWSQKFALFAGPKEPQLLDVYQLRDWIYYGWFGGISRFLGTILHFFHDKLVGNYALAIIMLTILVRGCMFPISRKAAKNAAMMQDLAPEMKKIAEQHKNNLEARGKAQQELFRKHNYNPLGGCWLMFLQLPVFIGLYRCLAVDIELRQAPLVHGLEWCSNLAGPDKLFYWNSPFFSWFTDESGWLGPYFNLLPIFTIALFLVQQKMFTPPATDENAEFQMKIMKVMTILMGVLFYKVPAGLCVYFITSSLWGIAERKLLPKPKPNQPPPDAGKKKSSLLNDLLARATAPKDNGTDEARKKFIRKQKRK